MSCSSSSGRISSCYIQSACRIFSSPLSVDNNGHGVRSDGIHTDSGGFRPGASEHIMHDVHESSAVRDRPHNREDMDKGQKSVLAR
jgi:hypothetical protein